MKLVEDCKCDLSRNSMDRRIEHTRKRVERLEEICKPLQLRVGALENNFLKTQEIRYCPTLANNRVSPTTGGGKCSPSPRATSQLKQAQKKKAASLKQQKQEAMKEVGLSPNQENKEPMD